MITIDKDARVYEKKVFGVLDMEPEDNLNILLQEPLGFHKIKFKVFLKLVWLLKVNLFWRTGTGPTIGANVAVQFCPLPETVYNTYKQAKAF